MNDERAVEVMAKAALFFDLDETQEHAVELVERQLAALRAEGFDLYRPDDCEKVHKFPTGFAYHEPSVPLGTYRLVPVGGEG